MDKKTEVKEQNSLSDGIASQNETEFFTDNVAMRTNTDVLQDNGCDIAVKMEIKSETPFPDLGLQKGTEVCTHYHANEIKLETLAYSSNNCNMNIKTEIEEQILVPDFGSQSETEFLQEDPLMNVEKCNSDHELDNKVEIKEELWELETVSSPACDDNKDEDFPSVSSPRLLMETVYGASSGISLLPSAEDLSDDTSLHMGKDSPAHVHSRNFKSQGICATEHSVEENIHSEQSSKYNNGEKNYNITSYLKQKTVIHEVKRSYKCETCEKIFTKLSNLKSHNLIHEGIKPYQCKICEKRFTQLSGLKRHNLVHEGKKPYKCKICEKKFTQLSDLKRHNLIHEGIKAHKCGICKKKFTRVSHLRLHMLIHEGTKAHMCKICGRRFSYLQNLNRHIFVIHESKKPQKSQLCEKSEKRSILLSLLKSDSLICEAKKPRKS